jgi:hypothetical protein
MAVATVAAEVVSAATAAAADNAIAGNFYLK